METDRCAACGGPTIVDPFTGIPSCGLGHFMVWDGAGGLRAATPEEREAMVAHKEALFELHDAAAATGMDAGTTLTIPLVEQVPELLRTKEELLAMLRDADERREQHFSVNEDYVDKAKCLLRLVNAQQRAYETHQEELRVVPLPPDPDGGGSRGDG